MDDLTEGQAELLAFCMRFFLRNHTLPPMLSVANHFGWSSKQAASDKVNILVRKGYLERNDLGKLRFSDRYTVTVTNTEKLP